MDGAIYHAQEGGNSFTVYSPLPSPGDALCLALTGRTEAELVKRILAGEYDHILKKEKTA